MKRLALLALAFLAAGCVPFWASQPPPSCAGPDQTAQIQQQIDSTPDGGVVTVTGCNPVDGELTIIGRHDLTLIGGIFERKDTPQGFLPQLLIQNSTGITVNNVDLEGPKLDTQGFDATVEGQPGIDVDNSQQITIEDSLIRRENGDFIRVSNLNDGVTITNNRMYQAGRQGIAVVGGANIQITNNQVWYAHRWSIDLEPYTETPVHDVTITGNDLIAPNIGWICSTGQDPRCDRDPATLYNITIQDNTQTWG